MKRSTLPEINGASPDASDEPDESPVPGSAGEQLLIALARACPRDLADLDREIDRARKHLDALLTARRLIELRLHGRKPRQARKPKEPPAKEEAAPAPSSNPLSDQKRRQAVIFLVDHGPASLQTLARALGLPTSQHAGLSRILEHPWFHFADDGYRITPKARQDVL